MTRTGTGILVLLMSAAWTGQAAAVCLPGLSNDWKMETSGTTVIFNCNSPGCGGGTSILFVTHAEPGSFRKNAPTTSTFNGARGYMDKIQPIDTKSGVKGYVVHEYYRGQTSDLSIAAAGSNPFKALSNLRLLKQAFGCWRWKRPGYAPPVQ